MQCHVELPKRRLQLSVKALLQFTSQAVWVWTFGAQLNLCIFHTECLGDGFFMGFWVPIIPIHQDWRSQSWLNFTGAFRYSWWELSSKHGALSYQQTGALSIKTWGAQYQKLLKEKGFAEDFLTFHGSCRLRMA